MRNLMIFGLLLVLNLGCDDEETRRTVTGPALAAQADGNVRSPFRMDPPSGALYPDASATGYMFGLFLEGNHPQFGPGASLDIRMHGIPCPTWGFSTTSAQLSVSSRQFYAVYARTATNGWVRLQSFTPNCLGENETVRSPLPGDLDWFTEEVTVEIRREFDDGDDIGPVVLRGVVSARP